MTRGTANNKDIRDASPKDFILEALLKWQRTLSPCGELGRMVLETKEWVKFNIEDEEPWTVLDWNDKLPWRKADIEFHGTCEDSDVAVVLSMIESRAKEITREQFFDIMGNDLNCMIIGHMVSHPGLYKYYIHPTKLLIYFEREGITSLYADVDTFNQVLKEATQ